MNFLNKLALNNNQDVIEAFLVSSYCEDKKESDARFVNLKFVNKNEFIFFSNYDSPKSKQFKKIIILHASFIGLVLIYKLE